MKVCPRPSYFFPLSSSDEYYSFTHLHSCQRITVILTSDQVQFLINPGFLFFHIRHKLLVFQRLLKPLPAKKWQTKQFWFLNDNFQMFRGWNKSKIVKTVLTEQQPDLSVPSSAPQTGPASAGSPPVLWCCRQTASSQSPTQTARTKKIKILLGFRIMIHLTLIRSNQDFFISINRYATMLQVSPHLNGRLVCSKLSLQPLVLLPQILYSCQITSVVLRAHQQLLFPNGTEWIRSSIQP